MMICAAAEWKCAVENSELNLNKSGDVLRHPKTPEIKSLSQFFLLSLAVH